MLFQIATFRIESKLTILHIFLFRGRRETYQYDSSFYIDIVNFQYLQDYLYDLRQIEDFRHTLYDKRYSIVSDFRYTPMFNQHLCSVNLYLIQSVCYSFIECL